jgi:superfamily I DNA/RNA helicase
MNLDLQQSSAVKTDSHRALVLAGAGSGKTRVLIERIAHLIEEKKTSPYEVMSFSFSRKAAGEIKTRLHERIGNAAYRVTLGTMHALGLSMINRFGDVIGLKSKAVTVYNDWEEQFLLKSVAQDMGLHNGKAWKVKKGDIDAVFNAYYQRGVEPDEEGAIKDLFHAFIQRCRENNSLTYGGLLIGLRLLIPTLAKYLHIKHILVDEVQDIDHLQWAIILEMEKAFNASLFVVGDVDQSIYEWRGAAPKYLVDHQGEFDIYRMEANYRSDPAIVAAANRLIEHNHDRITKTMVATRPAEVHRVVVQRNCDSSHIVEICGPHFYTGLMTAILARNHALLQKIDRLMEEAEIPHQYVGKNSALTNSEPFRRFHAFLKLAVNVYDNFSFLLIKDIIGLTSEEYGRIRVRAAERGESHFQAWMATSCDDATELFTHEVDEIDPSGLPVFLDFAEIVNDKYPSLSPESMAFISQYQGDGSLEAYLSWLATYEIQDEIKEERQSIMLMTIHAAKGLEWPVVIIAGCNEGIIPSKQSIIGGDLESERRLMYVAMTRARDQLILTVRPEVEESPNGHLFESPASRFIAEAGLIT